MTINGSSNFVGRAGTALDDTLNKTVMSSMSRFVRSLQYAKNFTGEYQSTLINAMGTGIIAPIVISKNPISKEDKNQKNYSAWRQIISGALAVVINTSMIIPFNRLIQTFSDKGLLPECMNKVVVHEQKTLEKQIRKSTSNLPKETIAKMAKEQQIQEYADAMKQISEKGILSYKNHTMTRESFKKLLEQTSDDMLKETEKMLEHFKGTQTEKYFQRMSYFKDNHKATKKLFSEIEKNLKNATSPKDSKKYLKDLLKQHSKSDPILKEILTEIAAGKDTKIQLSTFNKIKNRFKDITKQKLDTPEKIKAYIQKGMSPRVQQAETDKATLSEIKKLITKMNDKNAKAIMGKILEKSSGLLDNGRDFLFNVVDKEVKITNRRFKSYKDGMGIIVGLIMLPITCKILNWLHPRFMEKFFPEIANAKKTENNKE